MLRCRISTLVNKQFVPSPADGILPDDENAARIFDVLELDRLGPASSVSSGQIPLSPEYTDFGQRRYWHLALPPDAILAALITQTILGIYDSEEIRLAQAIYYTLDLEALEHGACRL